jgi:signal transduction histidine kinase/CheY-like chemotaxis protein
VDWVLDNLPVGVWVGRALDGRVVYTNRAFGEILGMEAVAAVPIDDAPAVYGIFDRAGHPFPVDRLPFSQVLATGAPAVVDEIVIHRSDGRRVHVRAFGYPARDRDGQITHVVIAFIDITREVRAEAERATIETRLKFAVDNAPLVVYALDMNGVITLSEGAGLQPLGVRSGELVGQSVFDMYKDHPTIPGYMRRGLAGETFWHTVQVGDAVFDTFLTPLRGPDGTMTGVLGLSHDTSALRHLQAGVIQSDRVRAMGALAASVAHEINNPLTYVLGGLRSVERALEQHLPPLEARLAPFEGETRAALIRVREELQMALRGVERIATITRDLRTFSRPDDTRHGPVDVRSVIEAVLKLVRKQVEARARLRVWLDDMAPVLANEARLVQVVMNLVMNAAQSLTEGRPDTDEVSISAWTEGEHVVIEVADTGPGVAPSERERIFEPFVTTKPVGEGTGLGLFVCRNIVRGLGGDVAVRDRTGGGALFRVVLPAASRLTPVPAHAPRPAATGSARGHIVVIDDDALVLTMLAAQLEDGGFTVERFGDSAGGLARLLADDHYDLVYCDLMMKGLTGMEIAARLSAEGPDRLRRVVFMTGGAFLHDAAAFVAAHAEQCVEKPFDGLEEARRRLARD